MGDTLEMELIPDKIWAVMAAIVSALGGYFLYEHKTIDRRLSKIETDLNEYKTDVAVIKESLGNLKEDTQEIKDLINKRRK